MLPTRLCRTIFTVLKPTENREVSRVTSNAEVKRKLADLTFESKRRVVDLLDVRVVLKMVDGQRYADVTCKLTLPGETLPVSRAHGRRRGPGRSVRTSVG